MPFYEYQCEACGEEHEALQKISDPPLTVCPHCGQSTLKKRISAVGFRLKGSGWYETDFKAGNKKNLHDSGEPKTATGEQAGKPAADKKAAPEKAKPASSPATGAAAAASA